MTLGQAAQLSSAMRSPPVEGVDAPGFNPGAAERYGPWRLVSNGPDKKYSDAALYPADWPLFGADVPYDATNGTASFGNLLRTQRDAVEVLHAP